MDNLVHSLTGIALAERLVPSTTSAPVRRAVFGAAIVAANAPDLDFAYVWITAPPLGFLLHHRGHTHTIAGAIGLAGLTLVALRLWSRRGADAALSTPRLVAILGLAASSHVLIDATNVFGVVLWYPLSTTWVFGDISFIFEPWLWVLLGVPIARQASTSARTAVLVVITVATIAAAAWRLIPVGILPVLVAVGAAWWRLAGKVPTRSRMPMALGGGVSVFVLLAASSVVSRQQFVQEAGAVAPERVVLDVVLEPDPSTPWCWSGLVVSRDAGVGGPLSVRRGTLSLLPRLWPATSCASAALFRPSERVGTPATFVWTHNWTMTLEQLRWLDANDCHASAWLRFGRVPMVIDGSLRDLRLENPVHQNFTALALERRPTKCPSNVPSWTPPRADALGE